MAALQMLNHPLFSNSSMRSQLKDFVEEQLLVTELRSMCRGVWGGTGDHAPSPHYPSLVNKAKSYYTSTIHREGCVCRGRGHTYEAGLFVAESAGSGSNSASLQVVSAFLLNAKEFPFFIQYMSHHHHSSSISTVSAHTHLATPTNHS